jgi:hypothetical protein
LAQSKNNMKNKLKEECKNQDASNASSPLPTIGAGLVKKKPNRLTITITLPYPLDRHSARELLKRNYGFSPEHLLLTSVGDSLHEWRSGHLPKRF